MFPHPTGRASKSHILNVGGASWTIKSLQIG
jgi:hypothetical protein